MALKDHIFGIAATVVIATIITVSVVDHVAVPPIISSIEPVVLANLDASCRNWRGSGYTSVTDDAIFGEWTGLNVIHYNIMARSTGITTDENTLLRVIITKCYQDPNQTLADTVVQTWDERRKMEDNLASLSN